MARYKTYNYAQMKMVAVSYERQILPGTFEHTLNHLIDHKIDLEPFAARYANDETGAPAYDPAILLKVILYAYSRGVTSSRDIAGLCRENIIFTWKSTGCPSLKRSSPLRILAEFSLKTAPMARPKNGTSALAWWNKESSQCALRTGTT